MAVRQKDEESTEIFLSCMTSFRALFLDDQCIISHNGFHHVILNWSPLLPLSCLHIHVVQAGGVDNMSIVCKFRSSHPEMLHKSGCSKILESFQENTRPVLTI